MEIVMKLQGKEKILQKDYSPEIQNVNFPEIHIGNFPEIHNVNFP
jgi:hypothetical protein